MTPEQRAQLQRLSRVAARGHGPPLADGRAVAEPPAGVPRHAWDQQLELQRRRADADRADVRACSRRIGDLDQLENMLQNVDPARPARRGRHRPGARPPRRRLGAVARTAQGAREDARGGRAHRPARGPVRAHAEGRAGARPAGARRPVPQDDAGQGRAATRSSAPASATSAPTSTSPTSSATRSTSTSSRRCKNAIWRQGSGTPVRLSPEDFEVERTEVLTRSATVLMLDVSLSMPMRDNFLPGQEGRDGAALAHHDPVPARLLRAGRRSAASPAR